MGKYLARKQAQVNRALEKYLAPGTDFPPEIHRAMRYSVLNGGKRLRGILALMTGELFGAPSSRVMPYACALELVHAYSLVHDDLPAMDDDDFRRGCPTCHKVFGEAMAILAGDALLTYAFQLITERIKDRMVIPELVSQLARSAGSTGMVGGQALDIKSAECDSYQRNRHKILKEIQLRKTAALIESSARGAGIICRAKASQLKRITDYARKLGLAFQIINDILDVSGSKKQLGKTPGKDARTGKLTYPTLKGLKQSAQEAEQLIRQSKSALAPFGRKADRLKELADYLLKRKT